MATELPKRSEVKVEDTWKLEDMYENVQAWEAELETIKKIGADCAALEGKVAASAENLLKTLDLNSELGEKITLAYNYAQRLYDQDTGNTDNQAKVAKLMAIYADIASSIAFMDPEIVGIEETELEAFYKSNEKLEFYRKYIDEVRRLKPHTLSAEMEKLISSTMEMSQTAYDTFNVLDNADMIFPETTDENGEKVRLSAGRFIPLLECDKVEVRKEAFEKYYSTYKQFLNTYASLYNGQVKSLIFNAKARKYNSTLECAVDANNVSPVVYKNLVETVNKNLDKLHRYVGIRKKKLGVDELHMYDVYTPIISDVSKKFTFDEAKDLCLKALAPLGEDYVAIVKEGFDNRWIDVYENQGKVSGAYSAGAYGTHPYVLMNFNGSLDNVFTLIHEMGHAMHSYLSNKNQPYIYSEYKIFVAEIASTCNEILLLEYLLENTTDEKERAYLLNHYLDMFKGTLFRQTQFAEYEMRSNELAESGEGLNAENLTELYMEINKKYYGPEMNCDTEIGYEWARIPHFYYNFYVYQYATSFSAAVAIAHNILEQGEAMATKYKEQFLSGGCSDSPVNIVKRIGIDMESPEFIQEALDVMAGVLDEMEKFN